MQAKYNHDEAIKMFATGNYSFAQLGRHFNVDRTGVQQMVKAKAPDIYERVRANRKADKTTASASGAATAGDVTPLFSTRGAQPRALKVVPKSTPSPAPAATLVSSAPATKGQPAPMQPRIQFEMIGPDEAEALLKSNTHNRPLSEALVRKYAQDMIAGSWQQNGATIVVSLTNRLLDGQHRLHAIVRAGVTLKLLIAYDAADEVFTTIDNGKTRSAGDVVALAGKENSSLLATAGRFVHNYGANVSLTGPLGRVALLEFIEANPVLEGVVDKVAKRKIRFPKGPLAAVLALGDSKGLFSSKVDEFLEALETGAGLEKGDPRLTLREWEALERARSRNIVHPSVAFGAAARAWNAFAVDKSLTTIRGITSPTQKDLAIMGYVPSSLTFPRADLRMPAPKVSPAERLANMTRAEDGKFQPRDATSTTLDKARA
ncbi:hypothetical protein MARCHEWKA_02580 [Brevundimonas phage vB_BpoS-Marchewka]|uniref:Uncharacterized protein n=1 Tax=Brevundimonas phage vB_BpoS-Marchewka TaxID=2948604 RepID=A0A9E7N491_9CAUD|nr:hypothetical protein MARCHEWKA_02580 [Brevundimonas phage vB_BpoS-Marchewka]